MCKHHLNTVENTCKNHSHYLHAYTYSLCLKKRKGTVHYEAWKHFSALLRIAALIVA